jgi:hypothetical protein
MRILALSVETALRLQSRSLVVNDRFKRAKALCNHHLYGPAGEIPSSQLTFRDPRASSARHSMTGLFNAHHAIFSAVQRIKTSSQRKWFLCPRARRRARRTRSGQHRFTIPSLLDSKSLRVAPHKTKVYRAVCFCHRVPTACRAMTGSKIVRKGADRDRIGANRTTGLC